MATLTIKGNVTGGTANPQDLTGLQVNTILPVFTSALNGLAPASGGGTTNFLRADGTWAAPPGGSSYTFADSLVNTAGTVTLKNDTASPTASQYYGTNGSSILGYYNLPSSGTGTVTSVSVVTANNVTGSVATATTTPAITLSPTGSTPAASSFASWDANKNLSANSFIEGITVTTTTAGTTTLVVGSTENQVFTGSLTQTIILPNATTLGVGQSFNIFNQSSAALSLEFNGGAPFTDASGLSYSSIAPHAEMAITLQTNGTSAGTWAANQSINGASGSGAVAAIITGAPASTSGGGIVIFPTVLHDTASAYNASTGEYTAPVTGYYQISAQGACSGTNSDGIDVYVAGSLAYRFSYFSPNSNFSGSILVYATSGQTIDVRFEHATSGWGSDSTLTIFLVPGTGSGNGGAYTPTVTILTSGSGTFTTPANASYIKVQMVGGGGGGGGAGTGAGIGSSGGNTTFGTSLLTAYGGSGQPTGQPESGAVGGSASLGGASGIALTGGSGAGAGSSTSSIGQAGGIGSASPFGGAGGGGTTGSGQNAGYNAASNTGSGGGGAADGTVSGGGGGGGGSGGYIEATLTSLSSTYSYSVGSGGSGGSAGTSGNAGGAGGSGVIIITTYYNNGAVGTATNVTGVVAVANGGTGQTTPFNVLHISSQVNTNSSSITSSTFTTASNSPALTFTPAVSGTYKVYASVPVSNTGATDYPVCRINNTSGGGTLLAESQGTAWANAAAVSTATSISVFVQSVYTLTGGTPYVFDIQLKTFSGLSTVGVQASTSVNGAGFYMFAERCA